MKRPLSAALVLAALALAGLSEPVDAAPDKTLGMALMSAVVNLDGTLIRGSGVVSVDHPSVAFYRVWFDRPINNCTGVAGPGNIPSYVYDGGQAAVNFTDAFPNSVVVKTRNSSGAVADWPFHLIVFCTN
jgi:hypothetical protein